MPIFEVKKVRLPELRRLASFFFFKFTYLFILRERERESKQGRDREKGRERIPSRFHAVSTEPNSGFPLTNCEIMT